MTSNTQFQGKKNKKRRKPIISRKEFLQIAGSTGAATLITQLITSGPLSPDAIEGIGEKTHTSVGGESKHAWCMGIDLSKCIGCQYCVWACQATSDVPDDEMRWNIGFPERRATCKRNDGIVTMDYKRCIGCRYCEVACPYAVRRFKWKPAESENLYHPTWGSPEIERRARGVVEKCTFCSHRIDRGLEQGLIPGKDREASPACVNICPVNARVFGDHNDPESPISIFVRENETFRLREDFGTEPKVHYVRPEKEEA